MSAATDTWQSDIAEAARDTLTDGEAVVVMVPVRSKPEVVGRVYAKADYRKSTSYSPSNYYRQVAWTQATRMQNSGSEARFYVVTRHKDRLVVWTDQHCMLCEVVL